MADLPALSDPTKRKFAVWWDTLRAKQNLTDEDVSGYDLGRKWLLGFVAKPPHGMNLGGLNMSDRKRAAYWLGLDQSIKVAKASFREIESEYWQHWCIATDRTEYKIYAAWLESIKQDIAVELKSIWKSRSAVTDRWWEDSCRPAIEQALSELIEGRIAQARDEAMRRFDRMAGAEAGARTVERTGDSKQSAPDGPDGKTIEKILRGETVRNDVLEKLEMADASKTQTDPRIPLTVSPARERFDFSGGRSSALPEISLMRNEQVFVNLTDQQKDLLRLLVSKHQSNGGQPFIFARSHTGAGICYPNGDSTPVANDDIAFRQLQREHLITFIPVSENLWRGSPTEFGIIAVRDKLNPSADESAQQAGRRESASEESTLDVDGAIEIDQTATGRNINKLRKECGWSFDQLAAKTGLDKKLILGHVKHGKGFIPRTLRTYADAFTKKLNRTVTVAEIES